MGSWDLIGKDPTGLSIAKDKGPITWRPWTGGNWSILGMLNIYEGIISKVLAWTSQRKFVLFTYVLLALYVVLTLQGYVSF